MRPEFVKAEIRGTGGLGKKKKKKDPSVVHIEI